MMKMLIKLDEEKIKADGKYDVADMWKWIDKRFESACTKEIQLDGAVLYSGVHDKDYYACIALASIMLKKQKWFGGYCQKWIMLDNEDDETLPLQSIDVLARQRKKNPLFAV